MLGFFQVMPFQIQGLGFRGSIYLIGQLLDGLQTIPNL